VENERLQVVHTFVDQLVASGCQHVCISPGSRSTPLTIALTRHSRVKAWTLLDERSAGYFALGLARATGTAVALVCTSGTAVANYLPAVVEAFHAQVPLLLLTADRPPELRGVGSNQTIDQAKIFGTFVKGYIEMPLAEDTDLIHAHARAAAVRARALANAEPRGPVHINLPFREPLIPPINRQGAAVAVPFFPADLTPSPQAIAHVSELLLVAHRPLIVCGPQPSVETARAIVDLARAWRVPVLADPLSQIRTLGLDDAGDVPLVTSYDTLLRQRDWCDRLACDVVVRFGATPTSKILGQYLQAQHAKQVVVDTQANYRDPFFTATTVVQADPAAFARALAAHAAARTGESVHDWRDGWLRLDGLVRTAIDETLRQDTQHEGRVYSALTDVLPDGALLMVGNSMPVRDADTSLGQTRQALQVLANRGASGIDGVVSTALGTAAANAGPTVLVIGDVSFYHDMNSLLIAAKHQLHLVIVLIHNDGGGIFSFLPQADVKDTFHAFRTSHGVDFSAVGRLFGANYVQASLASVGDAVAKGIRAGGGVHIVEVQTDTTANVAAHRALDALVRTRLEGEPWTVD